MKQVALGLARLDVEPTNLLGASDEDLARALIAGRQDAYQVAWQRFLPLVRGMARRSQSYNQDPDDLVQDVFLRLFMRVHRLREPAALRAFVGGIAARRMSELRRRPEMRLAPASEAVHRAEARCVNANPAVNHALVNVRRLLGRLPRGQRTAFILRFVEGMTAAEIATSLGVSKSSARRLFLQARGAVDTWSHRDPFLADYVRAAG